MTGPTGLVTESVRTLAEALWQLEFRYAESLWDEPAVVQRGFLKDATALLISGWMRRHDAEVRAGERKRVARAMSGVGSHRDPCRLPDTPCLCGLIDFRKAARAALAEEGGR